MVVLQMVQVRNALLDAPVAVGAADKGSIRSPRCRCVALLTILEEVP
jgi:hypothetical protein